MEYPYGLGVVRMRPEMIEDPYSGALTPGGWDNPEVLNIEDAFVAHTSTSMLTTASREQALEAKSLFCSGDADVRKGDRIRYGNEVYQVEGIPPAADPHPFVDWVPDREIPLTRYEG